MANEEVFGPSYQIFLNGKKFSTDQMLAVEELTVEEDLNLPAVFTIKLNMTDEKGDWWGINLDSFKPGDEIKVEMGLDKTVELISGEITALDLTYGQHCSFEVRGYDRLHRLRFGAQRRVFKDMKESDIASSIAQEAGLGAEVDDTGTVIPYILQNNQSNYEFLLERAQRIGYEIGVSDKTLFFRKSQEGKGAEVTLKYRTDFEDFSARLRTLTEGSSVEVRGWGVKDKAEITATATDGSETTIMSGQVSGLKMAKDAFGESKAAIIDEVIIDADEATKIATAKYNMILKEFITGEGKLPGNPALHSGKTITLEGIGARFSGTYYIVATTHVINDEGYNTTFKVKRTGI